MDAPHPHAPWPDIDFAAGGTASSCLGDGWWPAEPGFTRTRGLAGTLTLPPPPPSPSPMVLELVLATYVPATKPDPQRIQVAVNGHTLGEDWVRGAEDTTLGYMLPDLEGAPARISLRYPDALAPGGAAVPEGRRQAFRFKRARIVPAPPRPAAAPVQFPPVYLPAGNYFADRLTEPMREAVRQACGLAPEDLAMRFESLGHNCEFGIFQQRCGASPLGLLRFNAVSLPKLLEGLESGFAGADDPALIELRHGKASRELMLRNTQYKFRMHTFKNVDETDVAALHRQMVTSMKFLRRRLVESLAEANKICVFQRHWETTEAHILPLLRRLRAYGPNRLMFVTESETIPPGTLHDLGNGLLHGYTDRLAPTSNVHALNMAPWLSLCARAVAAG